MFRYSFTGQLYKYLGEQSPWHPGELTWPGYKGFPVLGGVDYNQETLYVTLVSFFYSKVFDLQDEEDKRYYDWVMDRIVNGWFIKLQSNVIQNDQGIKVYLEWTQRYLQQLPHKYVFASQLAEDSYELAP